MFKKLLLCFAAGITTLGVGLGIVYAGEFVVSVFQPNEAVEIEKQNNFPSEKEKLASLDPIPLKDLIYPFSPLATYEQETAETEEDNEFDPHNSYYMIGDPPKGFEDCKNLAIATKEFVTDSDGSFVEAYPIPPRGSVFEDYEKPAFKFTGISIYNGRIAFATESSNKISYRFTGNFILGEELESDGIVNLAYLTGKLTKLKNGKKLAEKEVKYAIDEKCWH